MNSKCLLKQGKISEAELALQTTYNFIQKLPVKDLSQQEKPKKAMQEEGKTIS